MPGSTTNATFSEYIYFDGKRAARRDYQSNVFYYFADQVGSARGMAEVASGSHTATPCFDADFYPFGGEHDFLNSCPQNYKFMGKERDPETNNDDFGARSYASAYGRFLSADWSSTPTPVPYANLTNPQTLNLYAMVSDNPESFADLDGHGTDTPSNTGTCATGTSESCGAQQAAAQNAGTAQNQQKLEAVPDKKAPSGTHRIKWHLSHKSKSGGHIVQEITTRDKSGNQTSHYWEAWPVNKGSQNTAFIDKGVYKDYDDTSENNPPGTTVNASARYYDGSKLPDTFLPGKEGGYPGSGALKSTTIDPHLSTENATAPVERTWTVPQD